MARAVALTLFLVAFTAACGSSSVPEMTTTTTTFAPLRDDTTSSSTTTTTAAPTTTTTTKAPDTEPPAVETTPSHGEVVDTYIVEFTVSTEPEASVVIDGEPVEIDKNGAVVVYQASDLGDNLVAIEATDAAGNITTIEVVYRFEPEEGWIEAIGDSVMLGSKEELEKRIGENTVDAIVSLQFKDGIGMVEDLLGEEAPPQVIVVHLGTNGPATEGLFEEMMAVAADVPLMVFINSRVPRAWEETTNTALAEGTERYPNAVLVDWFTPTDPHDALFARDGFHPKQAGRVIYAELVAEAIFPHWEPLKADAED